MGKRRRSSFTLVLTAALAPVLGAALAACGGSSGNATGSASGASVSAGASGGAATSTLKPKRGGSLTALVAKRGAGNWSSGLDPASNTIGYGTELQAIFGGLFLMRADKDGSNPRVVPNQAKSATLSPDSKTVTIKLRSGIKFSDGTPFNAKAVIWNFKRAFDPDVTGSAPLWSLRKQSPFTSPDPLTVVIHLAQPDVTLVHGFPLARTNWIASPSAYKKMGDKKFRIKPVGAGPFVVVSDQLSSKLVLKRNPTFYKADQGLPYLDTLTFKSIGGGDQAAYQAVLAGGADSYLGMSAPSLIKKAQSDPKVTLTVQPAPQVYTVLMGTFVPPFNNKKAREALYYATNFNAINKGLFNGNGVVVESFTTPIDLFYHQKVPGYRTYDPAKAKKLVKSLGGLSFTMFAGNTPAYRGIMTALQTQWEKVGMDVEIKPEEISLELKQYKSGKWQASIVHAGNFDPATGLGLALRFSSTSPYTGVKDPKLDALMQKGKGTSDKSARDQVYQQLGTYVSEHAYAVFGLAVGGASLVAKDVHGPGLTTKIPGGLSLIPIWTEAWKQ